MWATGYIAKLAAGVTVEFRPRGNSMIPLVNSGDLVVVEPFVLGTELAVGDIVLCKVKGKQYLHKVLSKNRLQDVMTVSGLCKVWSYQIGNNRGHINGWVSSSSVYGRLVENKRNG